MAGVRTFPFGLMLGVALAVAMWPAGSRAYTPEQQQACTGDAFRLCSSDIPDVDRVTACMIRNKAQLSPGCRAHFRAGPEPSEAVAAPVKRPAAPPRKSAKAKKPAKQPAKKKPAAS